MKEGMDALDAITDKVLAYKPHRKVRKSNTSPGVTPVNKADSLKKPRGSELLIYQSPDGKTRIDVRVEQDTVWLTQAEMAELFQTTKQNLGQHLKNIFEEGELAQESVVKNFFTTAADGKDYRMNFYYYAKKCAAIIFSCPMRQGRRA